MHPLLLTLVHEHGQEISRLPRPSDVHGAHISKSADSDDACAKIGRSVTAACVRTTVGGLQVSHSSCLSCSSAVEVRRITSTAWERHGRARKAAGVGSRVLA